MRVLITGASGFLGGRLAKYLIKKKFKVRIASRSKKTLKKQKFQKINWRSNKSLEKICNNIDIVINCAGHDTHKCKTKSGSFLVNSKNPVKLFKAAQKAGVVFFIFLSSAHVYRDNLIGNINENSKTKTNHIHGLSKLDGEKNLKKLHNNKTKLLILRSSNLFGYPHNKDVKCWHLLINSLIRDLTLYKKATILSKKNVYRNFSSIESFCSFIFFILKKFALKKKIPQVINYCSENNLSLINIVKIIKKRFENLKKNRKIKIIFKNITLQKAPKLVYKSIYSKKFNFSRDKNFIKELDNLILYCYSKFSYKK